jgi:hypothetical protein
MSDELYLLEIYSAFLTGERFNMPHTLSVIVCYAGGPIALLCIYIVLHRVSSKLLITRKYLYIDILLFTCYIISHALTVYLYIACRATLCELYHVIS